MRRARTNFDFRLLLSVFGLLAIALPPGSAHAQRLSMGLTPALVEAGSPELIRVDAPATARVDGDWLGHRLEFFRGHNGEAWYALAGVDVETATGPSALRIHIRLDSGSERDLSSTVEIHAGQYRTGSLSVAPRFVEPDP